MSKPFLEIKSVRVMCPTVVLTVALPQGGRAQQDAKDTGVATDCHWQT